MRLDRQVADALNAAMRGIPPPDKEPPMDRLKREPILILAMFVAIGQVVVDQLNAGADAATVVSAVLALVAGFVGRYFVTPSTS